MLGQLSIAQAVDVDPGDPDVLAGGGEAEELSDVGGLVGPPDDDLVVFGDDVFDSELRRERRPQDGDRSASPCRPVA